MKKLLAALLLAIPIVALGDYKFSYISVDDGNLSTTHAVKLTLEAPGGFRIAGPENRYVAYFGEEINMTMAAYTSNDAAIFLVAEKSINAAAVIDYSRLETTNHSGIEFQTRSRCIELDSETVGSVDELQFLSNNGFTPQPAVYVRQFFRVAESGDQEVALTYAARVVDCSEAVITDEFVEAFEADVKKYLVLTTTD